MYCKHRERIIMKGNCLQKRLFDVVIASLFVVLFYWWIYLIVALIIKISMPGPVMFHQLRTGYNGKNFYIKKFRTMYPNTQSDTLQATRHDPRITKWGQILRVTNLDELPQFLNVLKGEMSIVGPRPHMLAHTNYYSKRVANYNTRLCVRPGITGWAQVNGFCGETKTIADMQRRVEHDIWYIEHWSMQLDMKIVLSTIKHLFRLKNTIQA